MKKVLIFLLCLFSIQTYAHVVDVISAEYPVEDFDGRKTLCLTVVRIPETGVLLGIVESLEDCFYTRKATKSIDMKLHLPLHQLTKIDHPEMREHLQRMDALLEFYYSDGD